MWTLNNSGIAQTQLRKRNCANAIAQNRVAQMLYNEILRKIAVISHKILRNRSKILRSVPQKLRKSFANENPNKDSSHRLLREHFSKARHLGIFKQTVIILYV